MLKIQNLNYKYKNSNKIAIENFDVEINQGETIILAGPNGSGKTTLIKILSGILTDYNGTVNIFDMEPKNSQVKQNVICLDSDASVPFFMSGREYVTFMCKLYNKNVDNEILDKLLYYLQLTDSFDQLIETYSHGMVKKVQIICALLIKPKFIIVDETLNGIDIESKLVIVKLLKQVNEEGSTVLICTHDLSLIEHFKTRILFIQKSKVFADTSYEQYKNSSTADIEKDFINKVASGDNRYDELQTNIYSN